MMISLFASIKVKKDKQFTTPKRFVKAESIGHVVEILSKEENTEYLVEINNEVYEFLENELEVLD